MLLPSDWKPPISRDEVTAGRTTLQEAVMRTGGLAERPVDPPSSRCENGCGRAVRSPRRSARADRNGAVHGSL